MAIAAGHAKLEPGSYIRLLVIDAGEGMDEATLARAMDPFFTTKEVGKGTGLGLPMVLGLAGQPCTDDDRVDHANRLPVPWCSRLSVLSLNRHRHFPAASALN